MDENGTTPVRQRTSGSFPAQSLNLAEPEEHPVGLI